MGAWGMGMRENDDALDAIGVVFEVPKKRRKTVDEVLSDCSADAVLGLAEEYVERGLAMPEALAQAARSAIHEELKELDSWTDPDERRDALEQFQRVLDGKDEVRQPESLLSKLATFLGDRK
jgi:hypothetical protein